MIDFKTDIEIASASAQTQVALLPNGEKATGCPRGSSGGVTAFLTRERSRIYLHERNAGLDTLYRDSTGFTVFCSPFMDHATPKTSPPNLRALLCDTRLVPRDRPPFSPSLESCCCRVSVAMRRTPGRWRPVLPRAPLYGAIGLRAAGLDALAALGGRSCRVCSAQEDRRTEIAPSLDLVAPPNFACTRAQKPRKSRLITKLISPYAVYQAGKQRRNRASV